MPRATFFLLLIFVLLGCIEEDVLQDRINERLIIDNPVSALAPLGTHQLRVRFFDNVGAEGQLAVEYNSSNTDIARISNSGLIEALARGQTTIRVTANSPEGVELSDSFDLEINEEGQTPEVQEGFGTIRTTSSYILEGGFVVRELPATGSLRIEIAEGYRADTNLPGLYVYLSNNPSSIANALEIGPVEVFAGAHQYTIPNTELNDYAYLLYWCKPFEVKVGDGQIETE